MNAGQPARLRRASALILVDDGRVYLARRQPRLRFFGGFYAFPGGGLAPVDEEVARRRSVAPWTSALAREAFEELALQLHPHPESPALGEVERHALLDDPGTWRELSTHFDLTKLPSADFHLVTPDFYPLRFDTAFHVLDRAEVAAGQSIALCEAELVEGEWCPAQEWLDRWHRGQLLVVPPAVVLLEALAAAAAEGVTEITGIRRRLADAAQRLEEHPLQPIWNDPVARLLPLRTPTLPPVRHTNAYLVGGDPGYLVDPATPHAETRDQLQRVLEEEHAGGRRLAAVLLTHHHDDHYRAADFVRERWEVPVLAHPETARRLQGRLRVDRTLEDGDRLTLGTDPAGRPGWELEAVFTPGHAPGHLCFFDARFGTLIAGDMVSTLSSILIDPDDGCLADYEAGLERLIDLEPRVVYPAHGPADGRGARILREQLAHRRQRTAEVRAGLEAGLREVDELVGRIYAEVPADQRAFAGRSVESILLDLQRRGLVRLSRDSDRLRVSALGDTR